MNAYGLFLDDLAQRIAGRVADAIKKNGGANGTMRDGLMPRKAAAELFHRSASTMYRLEQKGLLTPIRINDRV